MGKVSSMTRRQTFETHMWDARSGKCKACGHGRNKCHKRECKGHLMPAAQKKEVGV
jgi:hypothetical protein